MNLVEQFVKQNLIDCCHNVFLKTMQASLQKAMLAEVMAYIEPAHVYLDRAADLIEERGWCQNAFMCQGRLCMLGAIRVAIWGADSFRHYHHDYTGAAKMMRLYLGCRTDEWNDHPERRFGEVTAALRTVALMLRTTGKVVPMNPPVRIEIPAGVFEFINTDFVEPKYPPQEMQTFCNEKHGGYVSPRFSHPTPELLN